MKLGWQVDTEDIARVKAFYEQHCENAFVTTRIATNLRDNKPAISKEDFWDRMVGCLLYELQK